MVTRLIEKKKREEYIDCFNVVLPNNSLKIGTDGSSQYELYSYKVNYIHKMDISAYFQYQHKYKMTCLKQSIIMFSIDTHA